jgi:hypothetical protein
VPEDEVVVLVADRGEKGAGGTEATAIRKCSACSESAAVLMAMGHMTAAVAALFMKSDSVMVTIRIGAKPRTAKTWAMDLMRSCAIKSAATSFKSNSSNR